MIISNPPYIQADEIKNLQPEISVYEPEGALNGGIDGLDHIRHIIANGCRYLKAGGSILLEIGFDQKESMSELIEHTKKYADIEFFRDYAGNYRVVSMHSY